MPTKADFDTANAATAAALADINADIDRLSAPGGLTEAEATAVLADVNTNRATAEQIAARTPNP